MKNNKARFFLYTVAGIIVLNVLGQLAYKRFDLTQDKRYSLSDSSKEIIAKVDTPLIIDVFLVGDFPSEFRRLQNETRQILEEYTLNNNLIKINYINPIADEETRERNIQQLTQSGLQPYVNSDANAGKVTQELIFPWAFASYKDQTVKIELLKRSITEPIQQQITNSIQQLEYSFSDGFSKLVNAKSKKIAVLKGNGQLGDLYIADFLKTIQQYYNIAPFTLDSVATNAVGTYKKLKDFDLIISAKPTEAFSENEKLVLDQFMMHGGKSLWLTEAVVMDKDSLYNSTGSNVSILRDLNLKDFFFKYGVRINPSLVKDLFSAPIMLAIGEGSESQLQPLQWQYSPLAASNPKHPTTKNLNVVKFDFASPIDTLKNGVSKTVLLESSASSKLEGVPTLISLADVTKDPEEETYTMGSQTLAVLLEGEFSSVYDNRILPFDIDDYKDKSATTKMVVISDGDVVKNEILKNQPQPLGFDRFTGRQFGNKEFLLNVVNYLLDDSGLINIRAKELQIAYLDAEKVDDEKLKWQLINIAIPLVLLFAFGYLFNYFRKKKYS
ncbi:MAG: gliding motility-associated ABC transporter substrate-binding protein GldG [Winogradskyella sp.]|nr:gliding motility-associated ABC transporter substrate-binding protein GldG [Winogradskyella sp.]